MWTTSVAIVVFLEAIFNYFNFVLDNFNIFAMIPSYAAGYSQVSVLPG
jgi:hypothetical protein